MEPVNTAIRWILVALLTTMAVLIGWQIFARFLVGGGLDFSEEASRFIMIWLVLLGAGYAVQEQRLIRVDALERILRGSSRTAVMVSAWLISIIFYLLLIWFGTSMSIGVSYQLAPASEISMTWAISALPAGGLLMLLNTLYVLSKHSLRHRLHGDVGHDADDTADDRDENGGPQ